MTLGPPAANSPMRQGRGRGAPYALTRGRDEPIKILEAWGAVRPARAA